VIFGGLLPGKSWGAGNYFLIFFSKIITRSPTLPRQQTAENHRRGKIAIRVFPTKKNKKNIKNES